MHVNTIKENTKNKPINPIALTPEQIKAWMWPSEVWVVAEGNCITYYFSREAEGWCRPRAWYRADVKTAVFPLYHMNKLV